MGFAKPVKRKAECECRWHVLGDFAVVGIHQMDGALNMRRAFYPAAMMLLLVLFGWTSPLAWGSNPLPVAVSIVPLADFTRNVGGDRIDVTVLVPAGSNPHTFEPTPARAKTIANARVLVLNGVGLEFWAEKLVNAANNPDLIVVETAGGLDIIGDDNEREHNAGEGQQHGQHHGKGNPHVWLDPINAIHQVEAIRDALIQADPAGVEIYRANTDRYITELRGLDKEIREMVGTLTSKTFISFHAAFTYFARRYGLEQVTVVQKTPGREPSPREIATIVKTAKKFKVKAIFAEPQSPPKAAQVIAEECGAEVLFIDPLGNPPDFIYLDTMRKNLRQLARGLGGKA
jgi:zinc transport system substrate-binding protein